MGPTVNILNIATVRSEHTEDPSLIAITSAGFGRNTAKKDLTSQTALYLAVLSPKTYVLY